MTRVRTRQRYFASGEIWEQEGSPSGPVSLYRTQSLSQHEECWDTVHEPPFTQEDPLTLVRHEADYAQVKYDRSLWPLWRRWGHWDFGNDWLGITFDTDWSLLETRAVSNIHSGDKPIVDIPATMLEAILELPVALTHLRIALGERAIGGAHRRDLGTKLAEAYLWNSFGAAPVLADILALMDLQRSVANQYRRIRRAYTTGKIGGKLRPATTTNLPLGRSLEKSDGGYIGGVWVTQSYRRSEYKAWYTGRVEPKGWSLSDRLDKLGNVSAQLGIGEPRWSLLWQLVPWSFLIDYFSTMSEVVSTMDVNFPWEVKSVCLMASSSAETKISIDKSRLYSYQTHVRDGDFRYVEKTRKVVYYPSTRLKFTPLLTLGQLSNLAALSLAFQGRR